MPLTLAEQLLLVATHDEKGSLLMEGATAVPYGLAGALLIELHMRKRIAWQTGHLVVIDHKSTGDSLVDEALNILAASDKPRDAKYWVSRLPRRIKKLDKSVFESLVDKGILTRVEKQFLWVIPYRRYPEHDPKPERLTREKLLDVIRGRITPTERLVALLGLVHGCGLIAEVVPKGERRQAKKEVKKLLQSENIGMAVAAVVREINTAVMVAVIAASSTGSSATSS